MAPLELPVIHIIGSRVLVCVLACFVCMFDFI
jgi:hypothetical protein